MARSHPLSHASAKLSDVRSAGGCSGCITNDDVANDLTISSSGSVDVGALSGTVAIGKGGTGLTGYTKGDIMYTSATDTLAKLGIGTSGQVLTVSGGIPSWADSSGGVSSLTGTSNQISVSASTGAITLSLPSTVSLTTLNLTNALGISYGGTGATTASGARTALGLAIGTDVQAYDSKLTDIAELAATDGNFMVGNGTTWVAESGATARTSLGSAASGANSDITSLSGLTSLTINPDSIGSASLGTSDTSINFTTEANYTQQDATDGTDFSSGTVILHNAGGASGSDTFNHTGANQTFTVPTGVTSITVKMWGAGGGGNNFSTNGSGGGGGYSTATVSVTPGEDLTILVGQGGRGGYNGGTGAGGFGGGGSTTNATSYKGSGGGGYSGIFRGIVALGNTLVIAGGGGGAGLSEAAASANGGAGGGSSGVAGQAGDNGLKSGGAGTPSAGGAAGGGGGSATAGSALQGGAGGDGGAGGSGGGGGGGYFGGGGGGGSSTGSDGGGGGGSGYVGCAGCSATTTTAGSGTTPGNSGDADRAGLGDGGTGSNANGDNGIVLITYTGVSYPTAQSYYVTTAAATQIDSSSWTAVSSVSITQTLPTNTNIKYLVSFDNRSTWKYWSGSAWTSSTLANIDTNGMTKTTIEAITSSQWSDSGGFSAGTLDFAAALSTSDSASTPTLDLITVNYTSNAQGLAVTSSGSLVLGSAALATTATDGFLYLTSVAGTPTGTPTSYTGRNALVFDSTNNKLCNYDGSWLCSGALTDYAEWAPAEDADIADLVSVTDKPNTINDPDDPFMLGKSNTPYDSKIVGVVSEYAEKVQVANLTSSSVPGVAMKATRPGFVIGKALEAFECPSLSSRAQPGTVWNLAQRGDLANQEIASGSSSLRNDERGISIPRNDVIASEAKQSCQGKILTFIQPSYADPSNILANLSLDADGSLIVPSIKTGKLTLDPSLLTAKLETDITAIGTKVTQVEANNQGLEARIKSLESRLETLESSSSASPSPVTASASAAVSEIASPDEHRDRNDDIGLIDPSILLATGSASLANLEVQSEATFSGMLAAYDLSVSNIFKSFGETFLGKTTIAGDVSIDGSLSINGDSINTIGTLFLQNSPLAQSIDLFDGEVTISKDGLITANKLAIDPKSLDTIILKAGQTEVIVESAQIAAKSKIFTSPSQPIAVAITNKDPKKQSFTIKISVPLPTDLSIDWWIVDTR
ncbi:MAG: hypothetical protein US86_C0004G0014 [Candidatus Daviesbacteria bacterium GW2011_GWA2_38_24]|uniref:PE-PGRS family protein n=1 Tax=Candidatus Daviesbacteria bacterium GW2011_GWA2_38_24 TaxID=1618422 RepID=A0A0G0MP83_9BACT|nr:MAG: hypothetical protein US86_C0004G0014 [Candidatus Daviesbacteria bacterium GW2011_GWA2_38_24]